MKIRKSFVSNSSSTSFSIYGVYLPENKVPEQFREQMYDDGAFEGFSVNCPPDGDCFYIGKSPEKCRMDQTMGDFTASIRKDLTDALAKIGVDASSLDFSFYSDSWYDA